MTGVVREILDDVRERGGAAVVDWCLRLDKAPPRRIAITEQAVAEARHALPPADTRALRMGLEYTPLVTVAQLCLFMLASPLYSILTSMLPAPKLLSTIYRCLLAVLLVFPAQILAMLLVLLLQHTLVLVSYSLYQLEARAKPFSSRCALPLLLLPFPLADTGC